MLGEVVLILGLSYFWRDLEAIQYVKELKWKSYRGPSNMLQPII